MQYSTSQQIQRRQFLKSAAAATATSALSYARIAGANDRIAIAQIGMGNRGRELAGIINGLKTEHNVEMTAVCDLWKVNRERAAASVSRWFGRPPRSFQYMDDMFAARDIDAFIISTADFQHAPILRMVAESGKDAYCEKPMANVLEEAIAARDAVRRRNTVVQIGTQHCSEPYHIAARNLVRRGDLGHVSKIEIVWNYHGPRWRGRPEVSQIKEADTDWKQWLLTKPYRPFDPRVYFEFRLYREFSSGIPDQWMSHAIDMVHDFMQQPAPDSVVAHGGIYAWNDGRENPDTFQALLEYPKQFLVSYSTSFGNDSDSYSRFMGKNATLVNAGGEGSQRWKLVEERGNHESNPFVRRAQRFVTLEGRERRSMSFSRKLFASAVENTYGPLPFTSDSNACHMRNWLDCLRSRKDPNANIDRGFAHSVAVIMAAQSYREGRRLYWDRTNERISSQPLERNSG